MRSSHMFLQCPTTPREVKYFTYGHGTHMECAQEICPSRNASLACIHDLNDQDLISEDQGLMNARARRRRLYGWIGLYSDPDTYYRGDNSFNATFDSWTSGCTASFRGVKHEFRERGVKYMQFSISLYPRCVFLGRDPWWHHITM